MALGRENEFLCALSYLLQGLSLAVELDLDSVSYYWLRVSENPERYTDLY